MFNCLECGVEREQNSHGKRRKFCSGICGTRYNQKKNGRPSEFELLNTTWTFTGYVKIPERNFTTPLDDYMDSATLFEMKKLEDAEN